MPEFGPRFLEVPKTGAALFRAAEAAGLEEAVSASGQKRIKLLPHQRPPSGDWDTWILKGGRNSGKTVAGEEYVINHLRTYGAGARVGIMAPTIADARDVCAEGETGLITVHKNEFLSYNRSLGEARHVKGGYVKFQGSENEARWNGPQWSLLWIDEVELCNPKSIDQADFGLRLGSHPRQVWTTTPKGAQWVKKKQLEPGVVLVRASIHDNVHASSRAVERLVARYGGTSLGQSQLMGLDLDVPEGACWPMLGLQREKYLVPMPALAVREADGSYGPGLRFIRMGSGGDWGSTVQHVAAIVTGGQEKAQGHAWVRKAWRSPSGSSKLFVDAARSHARSTGASWMAIDRSQWSLADFIEDGRRDEAGEPIGAGMIAIKGDRGVEWRVGLILSALEQERLFFDASDPGVVEMFDFLVQYHRDDDGKIVESEDDDADALCYWFAEIEHPTMDSPPGSVGFDQEFTAGVKDIPSPFKFSEPRLWVPGQDGGMVLRGGGGSERKRGSA